MKRIMIYKRNAPGFQIKPAASLQSMGLYILFFSSFLCGMILTCALFQSSAFLKSLSYSFMDSQPGQAKQVIAHEFLFTVMLILLFVFFSYSPFGVVPFLCMPFVIGMKYAFPACCSIETASIRGFGVYALMRIPSGVLFCAGFFQMLHNGILVSKKTGACVFRGSTMDLTVREMLQMNGLPVGIILISILVEAVMLYL